MALPLALRALALSLALVGWMAAPALAAPQQLSSDPEAGAELQSAPSRVTVTFSEPLEAGSNLKVVDECDKPVAHGDATIGGPARNELSIAVHSKPKGTYTVDYVATGVTGTTTDSFSFSVASGKPCDDGDGKHPDHDDDDDDDGKHPDHDDDDDGKHPDHDRDKDHGRDHGNDKHGDDGMHSDGSHDDDGRHQGMGHGDRHPGGHDKDGGRHGDGHRPPGGGGDNRNGNQLVAAGGDLIPTDIPTGTTVMISLGLAILLGAIGGWVLRVSTPS